MIHPQENREYDLLFGVQSSIRYHNHRCGWFEALHNSTLTLALLGVFAHPLLPAIGIGGRAAVWLSVLNAAVLALNVAFSFANRAAKHSRLAGRYLALESKLLPLHKLSEEELQRYAVERSAIEHDEPPVKSLLNALCYFESWVANDREANLKQLAQIPFWRRMLAHIANQTNYTLELMSRVNAGQMAKA